MSQPQVGTDFLGIEFAAEVWLAAEPVPLGTLLDLRPGETLSLAKSPDDPVDLVVNGVMVARGELVVVEGKFGLRITETASQKLANLARREERP